jgi:microcystin-dependent protein
MNGNAGILDSCAGNVTTKSLTNANITLTVTEAQVSTLVFSGTLSASVTVTFPAIIKSWVCRNNCTGNFTVTLDTGNSGQVIALPPNDVLVYSDGTSFRFMNLGLVGEMKFFYCSALPAWMSACTVQPYFIMDGSTFNATTYAALNTFLGSNTLPDFRGYAPYPLDNQGGSAAGRITSTTMSPNGNTVGATGGTQTKTLITANLPAHNHPVTDPGHLHLLTTALGNHSLGGGSVDSFDASGGTGRSTNSATTGITIGNTGSGTAFNGMPPAKIAGLFVIKT